MKYELARYILEELPSNFMKIRQVGASCSMRSGLRKDRQMHVQRDKHDEANSRCS
jgi:hypothetical protein